MMRILYTGCLLTLLWLAAAMPCAAAHAGVELEDGVTEATEAPDAASAPDDDPLVNPPVEPWRAQVHHRIFERQMAWFIPQGIVDGLTRMMMITSQSFGGGWLAAPALIHQFFVGMTNITSQVVLSTLHTRVTHTARASDLIEDIRSDGWAFFGIAMGELALAGLLAAIAASGGYAAMYLAPPLLASVPFFFAASITCAAVAGDVDNAYYGKSDKSLWASRRGPRIVAASPLGIYGVW